MNLDRRLIAGAMGLALFAAACGGASTSTSSPSASAAATESQPPASQAVESTEPETEEPTASEEAESDGPDVSFTTGAAGDLEALLPDEAGGVAFTKTSFDGSQIGMAGLGVDAGSLDPILTANGKTIADVRVAVASPADASSSETALVLAIQVKGLDATKLIEAMGGTSSAGYEQQTIGGKQVLVAGTGGFGIAIYTKDDVLFEVLLASDDLIEQILAELP